MGADEEPLNAVGDSVVAEFWNAVDACRGGKELLAEDLAWPGGPHRRRLSWQRPSRPRQSVEANGRSPSGFSTRGSSPTQVRVEARPGTVAAVREGTCP